MTPPSPSELIDSDTTPVASTPDPNPPRPFDPRWLCYTCGDLGHLDEEGVCRNCQPDWAISFAELCGWVMTRRRVRVVERWRIG